MARETGVPVRVLQRRFNAAEFAEVYALEAVDPPGGRGVEAGVAVIAAIVARIAGVKGAVVSDYLGTQYVARGNLEPREKPKGMTPQQMQAVLFGWARRSGAREGGA